MFHLGRLLLVGLLLLGSVAGRDSWEKPSFEDQDFDSDEGSPEYMEPETYSKVTVCSGGEDEICSCEKGNHPTLNCVGQGLESANLLVSGKMGASFQVQIAHLVGNQISYLFKGKILPGHEQSLKVLDFSNNTIMDIQPGALDKFNALVELRLTNNSLHELSDDIFTPSLTNLHKLYLDYNLLDSLDKGLFNNLKNLKKLVLDGNKDLGISNEVLSPELSQLEVLSMDRCGLKQLDPDLFVNLPNLRALSLSGNELITIPEAISPVKLPQLEVLAFSDTCLTVLRGEVLAKAVPKLEKLYMRKMKHLTTIDDCAFCNLPLIKSLDFSNSPKLSEIHQMAFGPKMPGNLESLNLRNCNFSGLVEGTLSDVNFGTLATLRLDGNPWNCDCNLKWMLNNDRAMRKAQQKDNPICAAPKGMKGVRLFDANVKLDCGPEGTSSMGQFIVLLLFMVMGATVVVFGVFYARRRFVLAGYGEGGNFRVPNFLEGRGPRIPQNQMGFASGRSIFDDDIEEEGEQDEEEETGQEAMATGQPRPEFV